MQTDLQMMRVEFGYLLSRHVRVSSTCSMVYCLPVVGGVWRQLQPLLDPVMYMVATDWLQLMTAC